MSEIIEIKDSKRYQKNGFYYRVYNMKIIEERIHELRSLRKKTFLKFKKSKRLKLKIIYLFIYLKQCWYIFKIKRSCFKVILKTLNKSGDR